MAKTRLDVLLVDRGFVPTRAKAQALIMSGNVVVGEHVALKPGQSFDEAASIRIKGDFCPYVSRGGLKLEAALKSFGVDPTGKVCVDIGASTGGFTDCLLSFGAAKVYAVDVGYGQLAWKLVNDPRVVNLERRNIRYLEPCEIGELADVVVADASFISLVLILEPIKRLLKPGGTAVLLVKPQFEAERHEVGKGGVIKDEEIRLSTLEKVKQAAKMAGFEVLNSMESPIRGAKKGNIEFLVHLHYS